MRFDGTLKSWNAERGFGFIVPRQGGQDIFVHITAFARDGHVPTEGEALSFEVETTAEGKKRAVRVRRPGSSAITARPGRRHRESAESPGSRLVSTLVLLAIVAGIGWYAYGQYAQRIQAPASEEGSPALASPAPQPASVFQCDGRTHCSQMTSCTEAKYFLKNCPGVKMDGNNDGVPCEQQWCTGLFAK